MSTELKIYGEDWEKTFSDARLTQALMIELHSKPDAAKVRSICRYLRKNNHTCDRFLKEFWCHVRPVKEHLSGEAILLNTLVWYLDPAQLAIITVKLQTNPESFKFPWLGWLADRSQADVFFLQHVQETAFPDLFLNFPHGLLQITMVAEDRCSFLVECFSRNEDLFEFKLAHVFVKALLTPWTFYATCSEIFKEELPWENFQYLTSRLRSASLPFLLKMARNHLPRYLTSPEDTQILACLLCNRMQERHEVDTIFETISKLAVDSFFNDTVSPRVLPVVSKNLSHDRRLYENLKGIVEDPLKDFSFLSLKLCQELRKYSTRLQKVTIVSWKTDLLTWLQETEIPSVLETLELPHIRQLRRTQVKS